MRNPWMFRNTMVNFRFTMGVIVLIYFLNFLKSGAFSGALWCLLFLLISNGLPAATYLVKKNAARQNVIVKTKEKPLVFVDAIYKHGAQGTGFVGVTESFFVFANAQTVNAFRLSQITRVGFGHQTAKDYQTGATGPFGGNLVASGAHAVTDKAYFIEGITYNGSSYFYEWWVKKARKIHVALMSAGQ